ncbi:MAG: ADP-ribosylglycohydrolase family protein [Candidatus Omnitrophica bacterium]|nr:ADP-ribosylglycohydrolase family protein [Candidatus Omnitrophota bacterium]
MSKKWDRRDFLKRGMATASTAVLANSYSNDTQANQVESSDLRLRDKFFGCIAGSHIASAMGAAVEGWSWDRIEKKYGTLDRLLSYEHYGNGWKREPGTTEDGIERQKLMIAAILEKQGRVTAEDVRKAWVDHMNPNAPRLVSEPFEGELLAMAKTHMPAADIGKYTDYSGLVSLSRSCHPIGLINAGDIEGAIHDIRDVGQLYHTANSRGIQWAEVTVVGIASAAKPDATVDSVLASILDNGGNVDKRFTRDAGVRQELERGLKLTENCQEFREMREKFDDVYSGHGITYAHSFANEIVTKAVCIFRMTRGNTWEAMKAAVNMGRDTDCLAAVASGISGALTGAESIPEKMINQVDYATSINPYTNSRRTIKETSDLLFDAYVARLRRMKAFIDGMNVL